MCVSAFEIWRIVVSELLKSVDRILQMHGEQTGYFGTISLVWSKIFEVSFLSAKLSAPFISLLTVSIRMVLKLTIADRLPIMKRDLRNVKKLKKGFEKLQF
jgi:hypothetical protein